LGRASPAVLRRESVVPFRMVGGRVYHQGLELIFPDLTIRTHGSVGLDQTLAIMAEMPVPPKWLGNNVLGSALKNQTIRLPIGGTLSKPMIDRRELERVSRQFVRDAARNVLLEELQKQLERLPDRQR
jgi:translocation and assembly module TamB